MRESVAYIRISLEPFEVVGGQEKHIDTEEDL